MVFIICWYVVCIDCAIKLGEPRRCTMPNLPRCRRIVYQYYNLVRDRSSIIRCDQLRLTNWCASGLKRSKRQRVRRNRAFVCPACGLTSHCLDIPYNTLNVHNFTDIHRPRDEGARPFGEEAQRCTRPCAYSASHTPFRLPGRVPALDLSLITEATTVGRGAGTTR